MKLPGKEKGMSIEKFARKNNCKEERNVAKSRQNKSGL